MATVCIALMSGGGSGLLEQPKTVAARSVATTPHGRIGERRVILSNSFIKHLLELRKSVAPEARLYG
jgi:hypothetical protein